MVATVLSCALLVVVLPVGFVVDRPPRTWASGLEQDPDVQRRACGEHRRGFAEVYARTADGGGPVEVDTCGVDRWNGSGFLLSPTLALTAHHVLADVSRVRVVFDHEVVNARVGRVDRTSDLALLELDEPVDGHVFDLAASSPMTAHRSVSSGSRSTTPRR
jgi:S1-C subfamily serine protease